ncbi:hypothetical protein D3C86_1789140 [compost metagenome]
MVLAPQPAVVAVNAPNCEVTAAGTASAFTAPPVAVASLTTLFHSPSWDELAFTMLSTEIN